MRPRSTPADLLAIALVCTIAACSALAGVWLGMSPVPDASISPMTSAVRFSATPISALPIGTPTTAATMFVPIKPVTGVVRVHCLLRSRTPFCQPTPEPGAYRSELGTTGSANS